MSTDKNIVVGQHFSKMTMLSYMRVTTASLVGKFGWYVSWNLISKRMTDSEKACKVFFI